MNIFKKIILAVVLTLSVMLYSGSVFFVLDYTIEHHWRVYTGIPCIFASLLFPLFIVAMFVIE